MQSVRSVQPDEHDREAVDSGCGSAGSVFKLISSSILTSRTEL